MSYDPVFEEVRIRALEEAHRDTVLHHAYCKNCSHASAIEHKGDLLCLCCVDPDDREWIDGWAHPAQYGCEDYDGPEAWPDEEWRWR